MNAVEIADAVSDLAAQPFEAGEFPFQFLAAFDKKETQLKRLRKGDINRSDVPGGVLLQSNIHLAVCPEGETHATLGLLKASPQTGKAKAKFILATDGEMLEAEELSTGETITSEFPKLADHIGFFLPLAGISTVREIKDNPIDVRATGRLNKLYRAIMEQNPGWDTEARRHDMNHFMARLIFCFFAEDTDIFHARGRFTQTVEQFSESDGSNTHQVIEACFRAMNTKIAERQAAGVPAYADTFPYVNGGLFAGSTEVPQFTRIARSYLLQAGSLDWQYINPDIFGSMIQAVADETERGALGMHYTSVPNILKVLKPLFLDELHAQLETADSNPRTLLNLRKRISRIRVFDPACGSGNFLVIAYKELRKIEAEINRRRGEPMLPTEISKKNFRGIEIRDFAAEIARLALVIAEYQCDVLHRGPLAAKAEFLPLDEMNWIVRDNALRLDWLKVCPPEGTSVKLHSDDLFQTPLDQPEINFENEGGEVFICGNPPYKGARKQDDGEKDDLKSVFNNHADYKDADYVLGWYLKAASYSESGGTAFAFVATSSICQGEQVQFLFPRIWTGGNDVSFAHRPFKWRNNASKNAGVFVVITGFAREGKNTKKLFDNDQMREVDNISPYLTAGPSIVVQTAERPISSVLQKMVMGNMARDDGHLIMSRHEANLLAVASSDAADLLLPLYGTKELVNGRPRYALNLNDANQQIWSKIPEVVRRVEAVRAFRANSKAKTTRGYASVPFRFAQYCHRNEIALAMPSVTPEDRLYTTPLWLRAGEMVTNLAYVVYGASLCSFSLTSSYLHSVWIRAVSGRLGDGVRYTPTISYHTFPVPELTDQEKADLTRCGEDILLAREAHFPMTIADLYKPETDEWAMPDNLRAAHDRNDETLERIYIGRRFKNDTERLETLFAMYAKMTAGAKPVAKRRAGAQQ